jgi:hypothetical protein
MARFSLYKEAYARINDAIDKGYFLEAVALEESLISDRLESRISFLTKVDFGFRTLERLIAEASAKETDASFKNLVQTEVSTWKHQRNKTLHEMAKLADGDTSAWADRMKAAGTAAQTGLKVLRKLDARYKQLRRAGK